MTVSVTKLSRADALRCAGPAVLAYRLGVFFDVLTPDGIQGTQPTTNETAALIHWAASMAEARQRGCAVGDILRRRGVDAPPPSRAITDVLREHFNAPKVWGVMQAVAGALQARRSLSYDEVTLIIDRIFDNIVDA